MSDSTPSVELGPRPPAPATPPPPVAPLERPILRPPSGTPDLSALFLVLAGALIIGTILQQQKLDYCPNDASRWNTVYYLAKHGTYEYLPDYTVSWTNGRGRTLDQLRPEPEHLAKLEPEERLKAEKLPLHKEYPFKIGQKYYKNPSEVPPFWTIDMIAFRDKENAEVYHYYSSKPPMLPTCLAGLVWVMEKASGGRIDFATTPWLVIRSTLILVQAIPFLIMVWLIRQHIFRLSESPFVRAFCLAAAALGTYLTAWSVTLNNHVIAATTGMVAVHAALRIWYDGRRQWYWFALAGFFSAFTAAIELPAGLLAVSVFLALLAKDWRRTLIAGLSAALIPATAALVTNYLATGSVIPAYTEKGISGGCYDYPGSYWLQPSGLDDLEGKESKSVYVMHMLIGHHGFFFLTPVLLLSLAGIVGQIIRPAAPRRALAAFTLILTAIVTAVYAVQTSDYGGTSEGFRWMFWVIPFWLVFLPMGVAPLANLRIGRGLCYLLLAVSVMSVGFALRTPWADSWAHLLFRQFKWIRY
ncbi:MAG TPA: hypothetical protein PKY77_23855 [Phycisphaerae bacterium]|nr:hypothetical protein [Phycisphaerae bacterium]HRY71352.1 hypothetical protein [Phycisphaerae bacterium]HSA30097.1 hypothetical protein [Phycisphaerae bacterium]